MNRVIIISKTAEKKINKLFEYLLENWNQKVKLDFVNKLDKSILNIQSYPDSFPESKLKPGLHKCVITKQTTLFYRFDSKKIVIVTIFDTRQNPNKLQKGL